MAIHWIVNLSGGYSYASYEQPGLNSEFQTPELIPDQSTRKKFPGSGIRITVHLGYPLLTVFCSVALEIKAETGHDTLAASTAFFGSVILRNAYIAPATSLHLTFSIELRTSVVIFAFLTLPVRILDGCYLL